MRTPTSVSLSVATLVSRASRCSCALCARLLLWVVGLLLLLLLLGVLLLLLGLLFLSLGHGALLLSAMRV